MAQYAYGSDENLPSNVGDIMRQRSEMLALAEQRRQKQRAMEEAVKAALSRYAGATTYNTILSQGDGSLQNIDTWERELITNLGNKAQVGQPYQFNEGILRPGDRDLVFKALKRNQRRKSRVVK